MTYSPGDKVTITYTGYEVDARVITHNGRRVCVRELSDRWPEGDGPVYEAAEEYVRPHGEPRRCNEPFTDMRLAWLELIAGSDS